MWYVHPESMIQASCISLWDTIKTFTESYSSITFVALVSTACLLLDASLLLFKWQCFLKCTSLWQRKHFLASPFEFIMELFSLPFQLILSLLPLVMSNSPSMSFFLISRCLGFKASNTTSMVNESQPYLIAILTSQYVSSNERITAWFSFNIFSPMLLRSTIIF